MLHNNSAQLIFRHLFTHYLTGLNYVMRKMLKLMSPSQDITVNDDGSVNIKLHSGPVTQDMTFRLEEEFEYDQRNIKIKVNFPFLCESVFGLLRDLGAQRTSGFAKFYVFVYYR